jgi:hypothetical protein
VLRKRLFAGALASLLVLVGQAWAAPEYKIKQYNGVLGVEPGDYWDIPLPGQIRIKQILPNETFEFEAGMWDGQFYVGPADINAIVAAENLGDVTITLEGHEEHDYGARDVGEINLSASGTYGHVDSLVIAGNLGDADHASALIANSAGALNIDGDVAKPVDVAGGVTAFSVGGDILPEASVTIGGNVTTFLVDGDVLSETVTINGNVTTFQCGWTGVTGRSYQQLAANVEVVGYVSRLVVYGVITGHFWVHDMLGYSPWLVTQVSVVDRVDGMLEVGALTAQFDSAELGGCLCVWGALVPSGQGFHIQTVSGTVYVAGNLGDARPSPASLLIDDLRPQGQIEVAGSVVGPLDFGLLGGLLNVHGDVLDDIESSYDITGRIVVHNDLASTIHTPWGLVHYADLPPDNSGQIVIEGAVASTGHIVVDGTVDGGRIEVGALAAGCTMIMGDLAGVVRVGSPYDDQAPMSSGLIWVLGTMTGKIFLDTGFAGSARVVIHQKSDPVTPPDVALFVVNADGANPTSDTWAGGTVQIDDVGSSSEPKTDWNLWEASCVKGDASGDGALTGYDIDRFVLMITDPASYCATYPGLCGGLTPSADGSFTYRGDLNCDGAVNGYDIDPFVLKLTSQASYEAAYPPSCDPDDHAECCPGGLLEGMGAPEGAFGAGGALEEEEDTAATAQFIVENVSAELRPALLEIASQLAGELPDPDRAALWAEVAAELSGE